MMRTAQSLLLACSTTVALAASAAGAAGCDGGRSEKWDQPRTVLGPIVVKDRLAYVDGAFDRVVMIGVQDGVPQLDTFDVGHRPIYAAPLPNRTGLAVLTKGREAIYQGEVDEDPGLYVFRLRPDGRPIAPERYELGSPFDRLAVSADGSIAVAHFSEAGPDEDGLFRNPNELAVVELEEPPSASNPVLRSIRSFGRAPDGVVLSPPMEIPGTGRPPRVLADSTLTILDTSFPRGREVTIRLTLSDTSGVTPRELAFAPRTGTVYVRAEGARDVLEVILTGDTPTDELDNDFTPGLAELGAGAAPTDIAVWDDSEGVRRVLAVAPTTRELAVIEADTAEFVTIPIDDPVDRILLLPDEGPTVAVLASLSTRAPRIHLVDLTTVDDPFGLPDVRTLYLTEPVYDVVPVPIQDRAMVVHDATRTVIGVLDVAGGTVQPIEGLGRLDAYDFAADGSHLIGATRGEPRVGFVDLSNLHPFDMRLDDEPRAVFALASGGVVVDHGDPFGRATWMPAADASRGESLLFSGFLLQDLLDEDL
jgi:hypothetical protein